MQTAKPQTDEARRAAAVDFLRHAASFNVRWAFDNYAAPGFRHHNGHFPGDAPSLMAAMEQNARQFPEKRLEIKRTIAEGDFVVVHSHVQMTHDELGYALCHIFRFEGEKIAELWDIAQPLPDNSPNEFGMF